jgi:hypothetical protein
MKTYTLKHKLLRRLRQEVGLSPGVQSQPGQDSKTPSQKREREGKGGKESDRLFTDTLGISITGGKSVVNADISTSHIHGIYHL